MEPDASVNVLNGALAICGTDPVTGYFRDGMCNTCDADQGSHTVCAVMTAEFLAFSKYVGNYLSTSRPEFGFAGLKAGDPWCLCAARWQEAYQAGFAPKVVLLSTHERALEVCDFIALKAHAIDLV